MSTQDIRWIQRFSNFSIALTKLEQAVRFVEDSQPKEMSEDAPEVLNDLIQQGLIQRFEYTHELAWKVMKDFLAEVGNVKTYGSKDATKEAFAADLIHNGELWMAMIKSRNQTSHTYNEATADEIFSKVIHEYHPEFVAFVKTMEIKHSGQHPE